MILAGPKSHTFSLTRKAQFALAALVLLPCTDALAGQYSDADAYPSLFAVGNRLFNEGRYTDALTVFKAAPSHPPSGRHRENHWAFWAARQSSYRQAECYDHLKEWRKAAIRYLMAANNTQRGTHFPRLRAADYRIVEMYEQAGQTAELAPLLDYLDRDYLERVRFLSYRSDEDFQRARPDPPYEFLRQLANRREDVPQDIADRLRAFPEVPPGAPLPTVTDLTPSVLLVAEIKGFSFAIPYGRVKQLHLSAYGSNPTTDARSRVRAVIMFHPAGPLDERIVRRNVRDGQIELLCGLLDDPDTVITAPDGVQFPGSDITRTHDKDDSLQLHRLRMPTGEEIWYSGSDGLWKLLP